MFSVAAHFGLPENGVHVIDRAVARTLYDGERLPGDLNSGFEEQAVDPDWCWVVERDCGIVAALLAGPFHGVVLLGRLAASVKARDMDMLILFRKAVRDMQERGFNSYMVFLQEDHKYCGKLLRILRRAKARVFTEKHLCAGGALAQLGGW